MELQRSTGILLGVAIASVATVAIVETTKTSRPSQGDTLYGFSEDEVSAFTIKREDTTVAFTKTDDTWQMTKPEAAPAAPSSVAFLLNIITTDTIKESITATPEKLNDYGLEEPMAVVELTVNEDKYTLAVGDEDFSGTSLYVMTTDTEQSVSDSAEIYLMPKELENGIERPVADWLLSDEDDNQADNGQEPSQREEIDRPNDPESGDVPNTPSSNSNED